MLHSNFSKQHAPTLLVNREKLHVIHVGCQSQSYVIGVDLFGDCCIREQMWIIQILC